MLTPNEKAAEAGGSAALGRTRREKLALARLEARVGLVDDVDAALAAHDAAILVAQLHRLERMTDLHGPYSTKSPGRAGVNFEIGRKIGTGQVPVNPDSGLDWRQMALFSRRHLI